MTSFARSAARMTSGSFFPSMKSFAQVKTHGMPLRLLCDERIRKGKTAVLQTTAFDAESKSLRRLCCGWMRTCPKSHRGLAPTTRGVSARSRNQCCILRRGCEA